MIVHCSTVFLVALQTFPSTPVLDFGDVVVVRSFSKFGVAKTCINAEGGQTAHKAGWGFGHLVASSQLNQGHEQ